MGTGGIEGSCTIVARAGDFVHTLERMLQAHSPPLENKWWWKELTKKRKERGFPKRQRQEEHTMCCRGEGDGYRRD